MEEDQKAKALTGTGIGVFCMAVAAIVIGAISFNDFDITKIAEVQSNTSCAGAPNIPYYLVIMGILLLSLLILKLFFQKLCGCMADSCGADDNKCCATIEHICKFSAATAFDIVAVVLVGIWNAVGTGWTFPPWDEVSYDENDAGYCPAYVYGFSCALVVWTWINIIFLVMCGLLCKTFALFCGLLCCKPCRDVDENRDANATV